MNTNSKRLGIYIAIMLFATTVATTLRTIACVMQLDFASGFFSDSSLISAANVIVTVTVFGMLSYLLSASRIKLHASFSTASTYVPTGILGVASAFLGVKIFSYVLARNNYRIFNFEADTLRGIIREVLTPTGMTTVVGLIAGVLAFVSIAHHFFNAFVTESKDTTRAYFSIATIALLALYAVLIYLDGTIAINETAKTLRQTSFLFAAIFFLYESRISLGREMWRIYSAFGLVAATLAAYTSIPAIITYFVKGEIISSSGYKSLASIEEYIFLFAAFVFIVARLYLTTTLKEEKANELVEAFAATALERDARVNESFEMHKEIFASKQLSFFELYGDENESEPEESVEIEAEHTVIKTSAPTISDDAIYESIFGKMPEKPEENKPDEAEIEDERDAEEIAEDLIKILDETEGNERDI